MPNVFYLYKKKRAIFKTRYYSIESCIMIEQTCYQTAKCAFPTSRTHSAKLRPVNYILNNNT
jgi:hypothetical protein